MSIDLNDLQYEISNINIELLKLLNLRAIAERKILPLNEINKSVEYYDSIYKQKMMDEILKENNGPLSNEMVTYIYNAIFSAYSLLGHKGTGGDLIVSLRDEKVFKSINQMFDLPINIPIIIAGPCSIENVQYLEKIANVLHEHNVNFIRGGAYKPRTSPYDFQGLKEDGLKILHEVSKKHDLLSVTEVVDTRDVELVSKYADVFQVGARNMQNYELLKEIGQANHPVILKRGMSASIEEFIYAAEYIALQGNRKIIMCERGIRTFETKTRNTLDISSVPIIKSETNLPIIVDLSHSLGRKDIICPIAKSVLAAGAEGIMVEVHPKPELALSDSKQQLNIDEFIGLLEKLGMGESC